MTPNTLGSGHAPKTFDSQPKPRSAPTMLAWGIGGTPITYDLYRGLPQKFAQNTGLGDGGTHTTYDW